MEDVLLHAARSARDVSAQGRAGIPQESGKKNLRLDSDWILIKFFLPQLSDNVHNAIRIHHALATKANDYTKKQHVFRLQTSDQSEYLFQTSDSKELDSWIDTINFVCASFSAPPLEGK